MHTIDISLARSFLLAALIVMAAASARAADDPNASPEKEQELLAVLRSERRRPKRRSPANNWPSTVRATRSRIWRNCCPTNNWPRGRASRWKRFPDRQPTKHCARRPIRSKASCWSARSIRSASAAMPAAVDALTARLQDTGRRSRVGRGRGLGTHRQCRRHQVASQSRWPAAPVKVRSAVAEGCVLCAERLLSEGKSAEAAAIYDEVRKAEVPKQRIIEATRGAILARKQDGIPLLLEQFRSTDKALFQLALSTAREFPGSEIDKALAAELARATPERAALMIQAMADRTERSSCQPC